MTAILDPATPVSAANDDEAVEARALALLAEVWETPLTIVRDFPNDRPLELRLGHFLPSLSERIAGLLDEAGL